MTGFILRRVLWMIPVLWAAATLAWISMFLIPGDPAAVMAGPRADPEVLAAARAEWGLDRPPVVQYARYLGKLARLDLGTSYVQRRPVSQIIAEGMVHTFFLAASATLMGICGGMLMGTLSAAWRGTAVDSATRALTAASVSLPTFWVGLMLMLVFSSRLGWLPVLGYGEGPVVLGVSLPGPLHLVLPSVTLALGLSGYLARVTRASLIEESSQEYALAARARGASRGAALGRHALANSLLPIVTLTGLSFGHLLGGAIVTETVFAWPGVGAVMLRALDGRDLPVVEGGAITLTAAFLLVNLLVDLSYAWLDPRTRDPG